jgi:hypothetical protein
MEDPQWKIKGRLRPSGLGSSSQIISWLERPYCSLKGTLHQLHMPKIRRPLCQYSSTRAPHALPIYHHSYLYYPTLSGPASLAAYIVANYSPYAHAGLVPGHFRLGSSCTSPQFRYAGPANIINDVTLSFRRGAESCE